MILILIMKYVWLHIQNKVFLGGIFESNWSCIVPLAFKGFLQVLWILWIFRAVWKTVRTIRQDESEESDREKG